MRSKRVMEIIRIILLILMWVLIIGFSCNFVMTKISRSFYKGDKKFSSVSFTPEKIRINDNLTGYGYHLDQESENLIILFGGSFYTAYNSIGQFGGYYDCPVISVDYYGTQESTGKMNLKTMKRSAEEIYDWALENYPKASVTIIGHSYGCGMAAYLASVRESENLVLASGYRDLADMYNKYTPVFWGPMKVFLSDNIDVKKYAENTDCNVTIIGSEADHVLNAKLQKKVADCYKNADLHIYDDIEHENYLKDEKVIDLIRSIVE